jgi:ribosomal protein S18 acetylase RimI-like enzyme
LHLAGFRAYGHGVPDVTIREVAPDEHTLAGGLVIDAYRTLGDDGAEFYERELGDVAGRAKSGSVLVAEIEGQIVGCVTFSVGQTALSEVDDPEAATIRMLGVSTQARGRGIGEALVRHCIDEARRQGCVRVRLNTRTSMASAQRLYERLGFRRDPEHDWSPASGISLLAYVRTL